MASLFPVSSRCSARFPSPLPEKPNRPPLPILPLRFGIPKRSAYFNVNILAVTVPHPGIPALARGPFSDPDGGHHHHPFKNGGVFTQGIV